MSIAPLAETPAVVDVAAPEGARGAGPRVRHLAREAAALMLFSAASSVAVAGIFLLLAVAARQA